MYIYFTYYVFIFLILKTSLSVLLFQRYYKNKRQVEAMSKIQQQNWESLNCAMLGFELFTHNPEVL